MCSQTLKVLHPRQMRAKRHSRMTVMTPVSSLLSSSLLAPYFHTSTVDCLIVDGPTSVKKVKLAMKVEPAVKIESGIMSGTIKLDLVLL